MPHPLQPQLDDESRELLDRMRRKVERGFADEFAKGVGELTLQAAERMTYNLSGDTIM